MKATKNYVPEFDVMQLREDLNDSSFALNSILLSTHIEYSLLYYVKKRFHSDYSPREIATLLNIFRAFTYPREKEYQKKVFDSYFPIPFTAYENVDFTYADYISVCLGVNKHTIAYEDLHYMNPEKRNIERLVDVGMLRKCKVLSKEGPHKYNLFFKITDKGLRFVASLCFYIKEVTDRAKEIIETLIHNSHKSSTIRRAIKNNHYKRTVFSLNIYKEGLDEVYGYDWKIENLSQKLKDRLLLPLEVFNSNMDFEYQCALEDLQLQKTETEIRKREKILKTPYIPEPVKKILQKNIRYVETSRQVTQYYRNNKLPGRYTMIQEYRKYLRKMKKNPYIRVNRLRKEDYNFYKRMCNLSQLEMDYYNAYRYDENAINSKGDSKRYSIKERKILEEATFSDQEIKWIFQLKYDHYAFRVHKTKKTDKQIRGFKKTESSRVALIHSINDSMRAITLEKLPEDKKASYLALERAKRRTWIKYLMFVGKKDKNMRTMPGDEELIAEVTEEIKKIKKMLRDKRKKEKEEAKQKEIDRLNKLEERRKEREKAAREERMKKLEAKEKKEKDAEKIRMRKQRFDKNHNDDNNSSSNLAI